MQFLGLAAPGNPKLSQDQDLVAFWRTMNDKRFQNYEAFFTVLDTGDKPIPREWLTALRENHPETLQLAPEVWKKFIREGRQGIKALKAPKILKYPNRDQQLNCGNEEGLQAVHSLFDYFQKKDSYFDFEACAADLVTKMDPHFIDFKLTRPWRDGGRDAIGRYKLASPGSSNVPLIIDCALEAKCYDFKNSVGVREVSRLISRLRYRQFGILVTTSYVHSQAYEEIIEDGHPILIVTASDISRIMKQHHIVGNNIADWVSDVTNKYERM